VTENDSLRFRAAAAAAAAKKLLDVHFRLAGVKVV
jgi:hypothetical protein